MLDYRSLEFNGCQTRHGKKEFEKEVLCCESCGSEDIVKDHVGYVCRNCGIVIERESFEYYKPYSSESLQNSTQIGTMVGNDSERSSRKFSRIARLDSLQDSERKAKNAGRIEIIRILNSLHLGLGSLDLVLETFRKIRGKLDKGTKYRSPEKLAPIAIYYSSKLFHFLIDERNLLEVSRISKKSFNHFKLSIHYFFPKYAARKRKEFILKKILNISINFNLGMVFYFDSKNLLFKLWETIKNTKDDVIAGLVSSLIILSTKKQISINSVCTFLNIRMSTIQAQVKKRIVNPLELDGFTSLVDSACLIQNLLIRMGIIQEDVKEWHQEGKETGKILEKIDSEKEEEEIVLIEEVSEENSLLENLASTISFRVAFKDMKDHLNLVKISRAPSEGAVKIFNVDLLRFYKHKGPPKTMIRTA